MLNDIPSPIDLRLMRDAREWEETAMSKRPWRTEFFEAFASEIRSLGPSGQRILELGSGPGFLAEHLLLQAVPSLEYVVSPTAVMEPPMFGVMEPATGG